MVILFLRHHCPPVRDSSGHDVTAGGVFKEAREEGSKPHEACLIHNVSDISVIPEIFIAQRKMRSKRVAQSEISSSEKES